MTDFGIILIWKMATCPQGSCHCRFALSCDAESRGWRRSLRSRAIPESPGRPYRLVVSPFN
eukprot:4236334-Prymnesium_polylepis.1